MLWVVLMRLPLISACSSNPTAKSPANEPPDDLCKLNQPHCSELRHSAWLEIEDRCIFHLPSASGSYDEAAIRCATAAPQATYHLNGRRYVARAVGARSFIDDFRWKDENGEDIATMYFQPAGWGMNDEFADRVGDCVAASPINEGGGVIYPQSCIGQLDSWCEYDCVLVESPLADTAPNAAGAATPDENNNNNVNNDLPNSQAEIETGQDSKRRPPA